MDSTTVARIAFMSIFIPNGMPKIVLVDLDSLFKGEVVAFCELLGIQHYIVSPEAYDRILSERFHRYLNKVKCIGGANLETFIEWAMNALFTVYAWNVALVDRTNISRSYAARARTFRFPIEVKTNQDGVLWIPTTGEWVLQHGKSSFPFWYRQKELLQILNKDRRARHMDIKNNKQKTESLKLAILYWLENKRNLAQ